MTDEPENLVLVQLREMRADAAALRQEVGAPYNAFDARFDAVDARLEASDGRIENLDGRLALREAALNGKLHILREMAASITAIVKAQ